MDLQYIHYHFSADRKFSSIYKFWYEHLNYKFTIRTCIQNRGKGLVLQNPRNSVVIFQYTVDTLLWVGGHMKSNGETTITRMITLHMQNISKTITLNSILVLHAYKIKLRTINISYFLQLRGFSKITYAIFLGGWSTMYNFHKL